MSTKEEAESLGIRVGDTVTPYTDFRVLNNNNYLLGQAWDDRIGVASLIKARSPYSKEADDDSDKSEN